MTDPSDQLAALNEQAAFLSTRSSRRKEAALSVREQALAVTGEAASPDGLVRVSVDAGGMVTNLVLAPDAMEQNPRQLAGVLANVIQEAASRARGGVRQVYEPLVNEGLVKNMPVLLPETAAPPPPRRSPPARRSAPDDDDDFGSVLRPLY